MKLKYYLRGLGIGIIVTVLLMQITSGGPEEMTDAEIKRRAAELGMVEEEDMTLLENAARAEMEERADADVSVSSDNVSANRISQNKVSQSGGLSGKEPQSTVSVNRISQNSASGNRAAGINAKMPEVGSALDEAEDGQADRSSGAKAQSAKDTTSSNGAAGATASGQQKKTEENADSDSGDEFVTITIHSGQSSISAANACLKAGLVEDAAEFDTFLCNGGYDRRLKAGNYQIKKGASAEEIARALTNSN